MSSRILLVIVAGAAIVGGWWILFAINEVPIAVIYSALGWGSLDEVLPGWYDLHHGLALQLKIEDMISEGDIVAVRYRESGAFVGPYHGQTPTERSYELVAIEWFEVREGKIRRRWGARDSASQARQLGMQ